MMQLVTGPPLALESALAREVTRAKQADPLAPVAVLIGGTLLRPYLERRLASLTGGIVNVRFLTPAEFALALGERSLTAAGRRPLPPLADRVLLRQIAARHEGYFEPVRETAGMADALFHLFGELRGAGYDGETFRCAVGEACETPEKADALASLFDDWLSRRSEFYGSSDAVLAAATDNPPWTSLAIHGLWDASPVLRDCLERLAERIPVTLLLPETSTDADEATADLRAWALAAGASEQAAAHEPNTATGLSHVQTCLFARNGNIAPLDGTISLVSAPDPAREVRKLARTCLHWAREGIRFHEMALVYRQPDAYRPIIESVFTEAGIPVYLHEGTPLLERPLGRRISALLDLLGSDLDRRSVMEFVTDAHLPKKTRDHYGSHSASRWDRISREAGVVKGIEEWQDRLAAYAQRLRARPNPWTDQIEATEDLVRFVTDLDAALSAHRLKGVWSDHLAALRRLVGRYVTKPDRVFEATEGLGRLDSVSGEVSFEAFIEVVRGALENLRSDDPASGRQGAFARRGVNVLDANSVRHLRFRAVAVMGLSERAFPPPPRPDPLLLDDERERLNARGPAPIPLRVRRPDPEPLQFAAAVSAASERLVASYARKSTGEGRAQLPSVFFRALAAAATGEPVAAEKVDLLPADLLTHVRGSRIGAETPDRALSLTERDRTFVEQNGALGKAALLRQAPRLECAFAARAARRERRLTPHDGVLSPAGAAELAHLLDPDRPFSPSALETYATCPHQYFLANVLGLKAIEEPEETIQISALDRGSLVHKVLERFLSEPPADGEPLLHGPGEEARLLAILDEECRRAEDQGETGYPLIWRHDRAELREDMRRWIEAEREDPLFGRLPHGEYEVRFGSRSRGEEDGRRSNGPIEITAGEARLRVSGYIDRLNWDTERTRYRVIDYKTGKVREDHKHGQLRGGRALQLPLYLLAGGQILDLPPESGSAEYHFATRRGEFKRVKFEGSHLGERREDLDRLLEGVTGAIHDGVFLRAPQNEKQCEWCDFDSVCPSNRFRQIERKAGDERHEAFHLLRAIE